MKSPLRSCFASSFFLALGVSSQGQTIEWASPVGISIVDSGGATLDETYIFELGAFVSPFVPDENNLVDWYANWRVFDRAEYFPDLKNFTGTANLLADGTSDSDDASAGFTFFGLDAYIWIRNDAEPAEPVFDNEWLLVRSDIWRFPEEGEDCCPGGKLEWAISDLSSTDRPLYGSQDGSVGPGVRTDTNVYDLQTHTFIPEPSSLLLVSFGSGLLMRRRRPA